MNPEKGEKSKEYIMSARVITGGAGVLSETRAEDGREEAGR
jgi:hypothetical protein